ncbi:MAG: hypothetical protein ABSC73_09115 [Acidimicrobiales bacterium]|jgi:hypothetical protein
MGTFARILETVCGTGLGGYVLYLLHSVIRNRKEESHDHELLRQAVVGTEATDYEEARPGIIEVVSNLTVEVGKIQTQQEKLCLQVGAMDGRLAWLENEREGNEHTQERPPRARGRRKTAGAA